MTLDTSISLRALFSSFGSGPAAGRSRVVAGLLCLGGSLLLAPFAHGQSYGPGNTFAFDGSDDFVDVEDDAAINDASEYDVRTIELWFKAEDASGATEQVLYEEGGTVDGFNVYLKGGVLYAGAYTDKNSSWGGPGTWFDEPVSPGWHHVALVFKNTDGNTDGFLRAYLDGEELDEVTFSGDAPMDRHGGDIGIGGANNDTRFEGSGAFDENGKYFAGQIDQLRLWDAALTAREIRARAKRTIDLSAPLADDLIAAYRFNARSGTDVADAATSTSQDGDQLATLQGSPQDTQWQFSGAPFGTVSTVVESRGASPGNGTVTVENVSTSGSGAVQVYRYGRNDGPLIDGSTSGEDFSAVSADRRLHVVWGLDAVGSSPEADVTFDFSTIDGVNDPSSVRLLKRTGPGDGWTDVTANWTRDAAAETFSRSGVSSFSQYAVGGTSQTLPVELTRFDAQRTERGVQLRWRTASEQNNAGFRVQRRSDEGTWSTIGRRDGAGTTSQPQRYRFADTDLPYAADTLAYRLKQTDTDGAVHTTDPVLVARPDVRRPQIRGTYPNPTSGPVTVEFALPDEASGDDARLQLFDLLGREVRTVVLGSVQGRATRTLDVSNLPSGVYVLRLQAQGTTQTQRLTVAK